MYFEEVIWPLSRILMKHLWLIGRSLLFSVLFPKTSGDLPGEYIYSVSGSVSMSSSEHKYHQLSLHPVLRMSRGSYQLKIEALAVQYSFVYALGRICFLDFSSFWKLLTCLGLWYPFFPIFKASNVASI